METVSEKTLRAFVAHAPVAVAMFDREMRYLAVSNRWLKNYRIEGQEMIGRSHYDVFPEIPARWREAHQRGLSGEELQAEQDEFLRADGSRQFDRWHLQPWRTPEGEIGGIIITTEDVTARVTAERALLQKEERLRLALDAAEMGIWEWDVRSESYQWNDQTYRLFGYQPQSIVPTYEAWARRVHPDDLPRLTAEVQQLTQNPREVSSEYRAYGQNDELRWLEVRGRYERGADGRLKRYFGVVLDITQRRRAEERDRILTAEVNHRAKNLLAVVQAVALQTARSDSPDEFAQQFNSRLAGLAASHDLLVQSHWRGVDAGELVRSQLSHFADLFDQRIFFNGPSAQLKASAAQTLGMAVHELATNASKYGALSPTAGIIQVSWGVKKSGDQPLFWMQWIEICQQPIEPPQRRGFGHSIMVDMAEYSLNAKVDLSYPATGVVWQLTAPTADVMALDE